MCNFSAEPPKRYFVDDGPEPLNMEARTVAENTCRQCGLLTEHPVLRQPVRFLGICEQEVSVHGIAPILKY